MTLTFLIMFYILIQKPEISENNKNDKKNGDPMRSAKVFEDIIFSKMDAR